MCFLGGGGRVLSKVFGLPDSSGLLEPPPCSLSFILLFLSLPAFIPGLYAAAEILNLP